MPYAISGDDVIHKSVLKSEATTIAQVDTIHGQKIFKVWISEVVAGKLLGRHRLVDDIYAS